MYDDYGQFIAGEWRRGAVRNRSRYAIRVMGRLSARLRRRQKAILRMRCLVPGRDWRFGENPCRQRADILQAVARNGGDGAGGRADDLRESGKPLAQAKREWELSVDQFVWYAEEARRIYGRIIESRVPGGRLEVHHEPVGIVAAFTARNFPVVLVARKLAPALAAGCAVVLRPSSEVLVRR